MISQIRNFAIIAHIDHGKSTLADRLLELTGTVQVGMHEEQLLDRNPISRERGITIKLAPVRMEYKNSKSETLSSKQAQSSNSQKPKQPDLELRASSLGFADSRYILNLIDTPGHVDFSYEVDRTLACVEGAILLVDATRGMQAQTVSNAYKAIDKNLVIIPAINKIDLPGAQVDQVKQQIVEFLGVAEEEIHEISAKTGEGVEQLLEVVIAKVPSPSSFELQGQSPKQTESSNNQSSKRSDPKFQALVFDSYYDTHRGVIALVRVFSGTLAAGMSMRLAASGAAFQADEVGVFTPELAKTKNLDTGEIGYVVTKLKDIHKVQVGDTIIDSKGSDEGMPGYKKINPMVFASVFPTDPTDYLNLKRALEKLYLNDSALQFSPIYSKALGAGFRVGFLGLLHADVVRERLEREYDLALILTPAQVEFRNEGAKILEPIVRALIITPEEHMSAVMRVAEEYRGRFITMDNKTQISLTYELPMSELVSDFFDRLKSVSAGYASLDWELTRYEPVEAHRLSLLINLEEIEEFSEMVVAQRAYEKGAILTAKLKEVIPRQQFEIRIQAKYKGKIIASERLAPFRKDVTAKLYGGDRTRKDKLLKKQKEGKKKMKMVGSVEIPKEAFMKLFRKK